ncbi:beta-glucosidase BglX [Oleiagrimonas sp. C23AA]|uniref:beta-glucosidase BglX n=1 Tax=Oleiagrimonas sp. C23AA TaxID=2719047 RepID=UPI0014212159|nr:beta-glucosidase BglX [Oleiagrimonas sp. C23AA]NII09731.1 beta-glucosidase BglX [Oleiagrimonas sp. C23AA]
MPVAALLLAATALNTAAPTAAVSTQMTPLSSAARDKINTLIGRMTLKEKAGQLSIFGVDQKNLAQRVADGEVGGTNGMLPAKAQGRQLPDYIRHMQDLAVHSRLGIPMWFMGDTIHGFRVTFPEPLALAATWHPSLVSRVMRASAEEATASGVNWTFAPMVDIGRDPRWGRVVEGAGEDPFLDEAITGAATFGFQGRSLSAADTMLATAKHLVGYGAVQGGRDYNAVNLSTRELKSVYLPPFQHVVKRGIGSVMAAFISLNDRPTTADGALINGTLRRDFGFGGVVVSDYDAVAQLQQHGIAASPRQAARLAFDAGVDIDLHSGTYLAQLPALVRAGKVSEKALDAAVRRVLAMKWRLGLFADPYRYLHAKTLIPHKAEHVTLARKSAEQSMVLLENHGVLPLKPNVGSVAVIGPLADDRADLLGPVHALGQPDRVVSILDGLRQNAPKGTQITYAQGVPVDGEDTQGIAQAVAVAKAAKVAVVVVGESNAMIGEGHSRSRITLPGRQRALLKAIKATGTPMVVVLVSGRAMALPWLHDHADALLDAWIPGEQGGPAVANVLFGKAEPGGRLPVTFPRDLGQVPLYYSYRPTGRPYNPADSYTTHYVDVANSPLYPFGYGLSYTQFAFGKVTLDHTTLGAHDVLHASVKLTNTGRRAGTEVVQLYVHQKVGQTNPPVRLLRGFKRVHLAAGASTTVKFMLPRSAFAWWDWNNHKVVAPGDYEVYIGANAQASNKADLHID